MTSDTGSTALGLGFYLTVLAVLILLTAVALGAAAVVSGGTVSVSVSVGDSDDRVKPSTVTATSVKPSTGTATSMPVTTSTISDDGETVATPTATPDEQRDSDEDGLPDGEERVWSTDPRDPDTDNDQLLDGWEVYGVKPRPGCDEVKLNKMGADPLHKDLFFQLRHREGQGLVKEEVNQIGIVFGNMRVENPDGEKGIRFHYFSNSEEYNTDYESSCGYGLFYFGFMKQGEGSAYASSPGFDSTYFFGSVKASRRNNGNLRWNIVRTFVHEIGHNILGELDDEVASRENGPHHSRFREDNPYGIMSYGADAMTEQIHPAVASEISRDGLLGLPELENWEVVRD